MIEAAKNSPDVVPAIVGATHPQQETNVTNSTTSHPTNEASNNQNEASSSYSVPTAVAPPSPPAVNPDDSDSSSTSMELLQQPDPVVQPATLHPNLKLQLKKVKEGSFLVPIRRHPQLPCVDAGEALTKNPPMVIITQTPEKRTAKALNLVSNFCGPMMRKAKNFTRGGTRSPTGTHKQRRYHKAKKRRLSADDAAPSTSSSTGPQNLQMVSSFAMRTMFVEDIWFLQEDQAIILFFNDDMLPPRYSKRWTKVWKDTQQCNYVPTDMFDGRSYKQLCGWVHNNKAAKKKICEDKPYKALVEAMNETSQNGVYLKFPMFSPSNHNITSPPLECYEQLLSWFEIFTFPQSIFIQADYHPKRNWASIFSRLKEEGGDRLTLLHRIIQETPGDRYVLSELRHVWERLRLNAGVWKARDKFIGVNLKLQEAEAKVAADPPPIIDPNLKPVQKFCKLLDETLWKRMEDCFGRFNHLFEKFLSQLEIRRLAVEFETMLPQQFNTLMAISGYNRKLELASPKNRDFLRARFTLDVLFQFIIRARKHNNHMLVPFGMLFAMAQYACGHPLLATQIPIWLGISVSKRTMERRIEPWLQSYDNRVKMALRNVTSLLCVFDNLQDGRRLQFQQGQSSVFTRVTARFVMSMYLSRYPTWVYSYLERPKLTYIQQAIPASYQMPALEVTKDSNLADVLRSVFLGTYPDDLEQEGNPFDCSGVRVRTHQQIIGWCRELRAIKRYMSTKRRKGYKVDYTLQPPEFAINHARTTICEAMHHLRKDRDSNVFQMAAEFQRRVIRTWRYLPPVAELLILPVSVLDETTKTGATGIILDFMVLHGLLEWDPRTAMYCHGSSWEDKWLFIVGNGLSIDRIFQFFDDNMAITDSSVSSYRAAYRQAMTISQVVHRVVPINGDLHVRFHMLDAIYRLFYGGFLQCMQVRLKWKRLNASDVSKSYRLAHRLAMLVFEEVDRIVLDIFVYRTVSEETVDGYLHHGQEEELAVFLA